MANGDEVGRGAMGDWRLETADPWHTSYDLAGSVIDLLKTDPVQNLGPWNGQR